MRLLSFLFVILSSSLLAQTSLGEVSDPEAMKILDAVKNDFNLYAAHKYQFQLDIEYPGHEGSQVNGHLIQKGDNFVLDMDERKIISDNESVWVYLKERNEVQINDVEEDVEEGEDLIKPSDIFKLIESGDFLFAISNHIFEDGRDITQIECKPLKTNSEYSKLRFSIIDKENDLKRVKVFYKDGSRMNMRIENHIKDFQTTDKMFKFAESDYDGVIVEDLRW